MLYFLLFVLKSPYKKMQVKLLLNFKSTILFAILLRLANNRAKTLQNRALARFFCVYRQGMIITHSINK